MDYKEKWISLKSQLKEEFIEQINYCNQHNITDANDDWSSGWNMSTAQQLYTNLRMMCELDGEDFKVLEKEIDEQIKKE
ncbi:hypothetical protein YN120080_18 [Staphylococcus phage vB_SauM_JDYN]|nr:hypothetical protein YN120080_18 [Staphylococcus phage vB_SauM_JDYN]